MSDDIKSHPNTLELPALNYILHDDVLQWLIENVNDTDWQVTHIDDSFLICFKNTIDAVAFKMAWY